VNELIYTCKQIVRFQSSSGFPYLFHRFSYVPTIKEKLKQMKKTEL